MTKNLFPWSLVAALVLFATSSLAQSPKLEAAENSTMDADMFYNILRAELANFDSNHGDAFRLYLALARKTPREELFERATRIPLDARDGDTARMVATEWSRSLPKSAQAQHYLFLINFAQRQYSNMLPALRQYLALTPESERERAILELTRYFSQISEKQAAINELLKILTPYVESTASLPATKAAARMTIARGQVDSSRFQHALDQLRLLTSETPDSVDGWLLKGALEQQENLFADAEKSLLRFLQLADSNNLPAGHSARIQAYLGLAQLTENRKDYEAAQNWLTKIEDDKERLTAQVRRASIMAKQGKVTEARTLIQEIPERTRAQSRSKIVAEAHLLRDYDQLTDAIGLIEKAIADTPNDEPEDTDLMYELSTLHEKAKNYDKMESLLREVIALQPNNAAAYNALGYSFADRGVHLEEAKTLIEKALQITPGDPYIVDSLAWAFFRMGKLDESLSALQTAYKTRADAEIGAHMGEVLWTMNRKEEAIKIWKEAQIINADNTTLLETLKRLGVGGL